MTPTVFISYSHDSEAHKSWVRKLAGDLMSRGIQVILDQWHLALGQDVVVFMERAVTDADRVLLVCSERYVAKADDRDGGVGYEGVIVSSEIAGKIATRKFIPLIRNGASLPTLPKFLGVRRYQDFSDDAKYDTLLEELAREL